MQSSWRRKCNRCGTIHHFWWDWYGCCREKKPSFIYRIMNIFKLQKKTKLP